MATKTKKKKSKTKRKKKTNKNIKITFNINKKALIAFILVIVVALGVFAGVKFRPTHSEKAPVLTELNKDVAVGADLSHHNGKIDFEKLKKDVDFVIIRIGYRGYSNGEICLDKKAKQNIEAASKANIPVGLYFYSQAITPAEARQEARFAVKQAKKYDISLPIFYDFEYAEDKGQKVGRLYEANLNAKDNTELVNSFCDVVEKAGYQSGVYASSYMYKSRFKVGKISKNAYIWVADYNEKITYGGKYDIWQYTSKASNEAIKSKHVDMNYWYLK